MTLLLDLSQNKKKIGKHVPDSLPCLCLPSDYMRRCQQEICCRHLQNSDLTGTRELARQELASMLLPHASHTFLIFFIELGS